MATQLSVLRLEIQQMRQDPKLPYRKIAAKFPKGISGATIQQIENGRIPGPKISAILGIPYSAHVSVIGGGNVPDGAQAVSATRCACGQWFISNHPCRRRCFVCSPYRGRRV